MPSRIAHALAALSTVVVVGCESTHTPLAPSRVPIVAAVVSPSSAPEALPLRAPGTHDSPTGIVVNRGELDFDQNAGVLSLYGNRAFALIGHVSRGGGVMDAVESCVASNCEPGATIPLGATWSGTDLPATVTLDGTTYTNVGSLATAAAADVRFSGNLVAPPLTKRAFAVAMAPFTLMGQFVHGDGELLVTETLTGEGVAKVWLVNRQSGPGWAVERVVYRFKQ